MNTNSVIFENHIPRCRNQLYPLGAINMPKNERCISNLLQEHFHSKMNTNECMKLQLSVILLLLLLFILFFSE
jgi:hypothetical protein